MHCLILFEDSQIYILAIAVTRLNSSAIRADTQKSHFFAAYPIQKTQR